MAGFVYEGDMASIMAGEREDLSLLTKTYIKHLMDEISSPRFDRLRLNLLKKQPSRRPKKEQRTLVCEHPTYRQLMGHFTEQCFVKKREKAATAKDSRSSQSKLTEDDTQESDTLSKQHRIEMAVDD